MANDLAEIIAAVGGILGAIGGLYAARAASRSASLAQNAVKQAEKAERRGMMRDFIGSAQKVLVECGRIESIAIDLKLQYRTLFTFAGQNGSSRQQLYLEQIDAKLQAIAPIQEEAKKLMEAHRSLANTSEEDMNLALAKLEANLVTTQGVREEFQRELAEVSTQNHQYRENRINAKP
jgi:hypothetical protein